MNSSLNDSNNKSFGNSLLIANILVNPIFCPTLSFCSTLIKERFLSQIFVARIKNVKIIFQLLKKLFKKIIGIFVISSLSLLAYAKLNHLYYFNYFIVILILFFISFINYDFYYEKSFMSFGISSPTTSRLLSDDYRSNAHHLKTYVTILNLFYFYANQ